eukprot:6202742-Pleurochrysis_carterae.AAC.5
MPEQWPNVYLNFGGWGQCVVAFSRPCNRVYDRSLLLKSLTEVSLTEFNTLHHAYTMLNWSLPAHGQLGDSLIAEKNCTVVRRQSESINTILDVKLVMNGATGNLALTLTTIREVLGGFEVEPRRYRHLLRRGRIG